MKPTKPKVVIGLDPGMKTGFAVKDLATGKYLTVETIRRTDIQERILGMMEQYEVYVVYEDARLRKWYGAYEQILYRKFMAGAKMTAIERNTYKGLLKGAGNVEGSCSYIEEFCKKHRIKRLGVAPTAGKTKVSDTVLRRITGLESLDSHAGDAVMLIQAYNPINLSLHFGLRNKSTSTR